MSYVEFMGKDNVALPHRSASRRRILGPSTASRGSWSTTSRRFNWLNYYGGKFSTSQGRGVFMDQALELLPADYWRWWLIANSPESSDATFTWESSRPR